MPNYVTASFLASQDDLDQMVARIQILDDSEPIAVMQSRYGQFTLQTDRGVDGHALAATLRRLANQLDDAQTDHDAAAQLVDLGLESVTS